MIYELAKQLKDAGFPQTSPGMPFLLTHINDKGAIDEMCVNPSLAQLIKACGEHFALHKNSDHWKAWQINSNPREPNAANFEEIGSTPEESVARLWLALNQKRVGENKN